MREAATRLSPHAPRSLGEVWIALAGLSAVFLFEMLDNSILNVALPTIERELHASTTALQWVTGAYTVVFGGLSILAWLASSLGWALGHVWVIGGIFSLGFGAIGWIIGLVTFVAWVGLMILAFGSAKTFIAGPRYDRYM